MGRRDKRRRRNRVKGKRRQQLREIRAEVATTEPRKRREWIIKPRGADWQLKLVDSGVTMLPSAAPPEAQEFLKRRSAFPR